ncbi:MAG: phospho-sugar mutase [Christensenellaceae bacterium]|jgi:phosphoglucomutase
MMDYKQAYSAWQKALAGTAHEKELFALGQDEDLLKDSFYTEMEFGTAGMRGIIGLGTNRMNVYTVRRATQALARHVADIKGQGRGVAIAYDTRHKSRLFAEETAGVLLKNGIRVYMYMTPHSVPQLSFTVRELGCAAGVVITASHNPPQYNGYKVFGEDGGQISTPLAQKITGYITEIDDLFSVSGVDIQSNPLFNEIGNELDEVYYRKVEALCIHRDSIREQADKIKIVYTPLYGVGLTPVKRVLGDLGLNQLYVVAEQEHPNPDFPTVETPNPEERETLALAMQLAENVDAGLILATDPDSDRLGVAVRNEDGGFTVLNGNEIGCLLMEYVLSQSKRDFSGGEYVIKSVVTSDLVNRIAECYGVELKTVYTGFRFIAEAIRKSELEGNSRFVFGFEESHGYLRGDFVRDKDAIQAAMSIAEAACYYASKGKSLLQSVRDMYEKHGYYLEKVVFRVLYGQEGIAKIQNAVQTLRKEHPRQIGPFKVTALRDYLKGERIDLSTGQKAKIDMEPSNVLYYELDGARFVIRPSGTEPKIKTYLSAVAAGKSEAEQKMKELEQAVREMLEALLA